MDIVMVLQIIFFAIFVFSTAIYWCIFFACHNDEVKGVINSLYLGIYGFVNGFNLAAVIVSFI